jgi:hypothetical protein
LRCGRTGRGGPAMIAPKTVTEVRRLLAEGVLSQRKIAGLTGVSRGTVGAIASGARPDYAALRPPGDGEWEESAGPAVRCPGCGGMVYLPCRLCHVRTAIAKTPRPATPGLAISSGEPLKLDLRPDHRARYEEVRAGRREQGSCY